MIHDATLSVLGTRARTWINAFVIDAVAVGRTLRAEDAFRTTVG